MVVISRGDFIWIEAATSSSSLSNLAPIGARVLNPANLTGDKIFVIDDDGNERKLSTEKRIRIMHPTSIQGVEDLVQLVDLHEAAIIRNLLIRFCEKLIYTYSGAILIVVNPYKNLFLNSNDQMCFYHKQLIGTAPPHIFAIANNAYNNILNNNYCVDQDQCIIFTGESGAGKTENVKFILQYYLNIVKSSEIKAICIKQQICDANFILEAFGNAKTIRNNNSSRFGKFINLQFNANNGLLESAKFDYFLLEKSRVVLQTPGESNFHIFYSLLKGLNSSEKFKLELGFIENYNILNQNLNQQHSNDTCDNFNLIKLFEIQNAMKVLMFKDAEIVSIYKVLAALLHTGNLKYQVKIIEDKETIIVYDLLNVNRIAKILELDVENIKNAFSKQTIISDSGECVILNLNATQALDVRDAFIKFVYDKLFDYIVRRINEAIYRLPSTTTSHCNYQTCNSKKNNKNEQNQVQKINKCKRRSIGLLDIFGFEDVGFPYNSFEQLCINYSSERIHQFYIQKIFKLEQIEYEAQNIEWKPVVYGEIDNLLLLEMLAIQPLSIFSIINDESIYPQTTNQTLLEKIHENHFHNENYYLKPKSELSKLFGINHYTGPIFYQINGFVEKNRDHFSSDLTTLIKSSRFRFLHRIFENNENKKTGAITKNSNCSTNFQTVGLCFKQSLELLINCLEIRHSYFIFCIKSNDLNKPMHFDRNYVTKQIRCTGMLENTQMQKNSYPVRYDYSNFVKQYQVFLKNNVTTGETIDCVKASQYICATTLGSEHNDYKFGITKVFLKAEHEAFLQKELHNILMYYAKVIQKTIRGWIQRRNFNRLCVAAIILQKNWRAFAQRLKYKKILIGTERLQAAFRSYQLVMHYNYLKSVIINFQAYCRGSILRRILRNTNSRNECCAAILERVNESYLYENNFDYNDNELIDRINVQQNKHSYTKKMFYQYSEKNEMEKNSLNDKNLSIYKFDKFAAAYFMHQATATFSRKLPFYFLLQHNSYAEKIASITLRICTLKFMNDLPKEFLKNCNNDESFNSQHNRVSMVQIHASLSKSYNQNDYKEFIQSVFHSIAITKYNENQSQQLSQKSDNGSINANSINESIKQDNDFYGKFISSINNISNYDLVVFICAHGIINPSLRDEIFCQICKQLSKSNLSRLSQERGWLLLALCVGCFAPSQRFINYFKCFLNENNLMIVNDYNMFIKVRLKRTLKNGSRRQPPCLLEFESCKQIKLIKLSVLFMDDSSHTVNADSASNSIEICDKLCRKVGLKLADDKKLIPTFGFSLYIAFADKVTSLGSGLDHVFDAITQSEQHTKNNDINKISWRLFFRKEIFTPWHDSTLNLISTNLIYEQIIRGISFGEYICEKENDLAIICAQRYFIQYNGVNCINVDLLESELPNYLPKNKLIKSDNNLSIEKWVQLILNAFRKKFSKDEKVSIETVKSEVLSFAMNKWSLLFSSFYEVFKFAGPPLPTNELVIAINSKCLTILNHDNHKLFDYSFPEIASVSCTISKCIGADSVTLKIINGITYTFQSPNAQDICKLVEYFLKGLQKRSKYLLSMRFIDSSGSDNTFTNQTSLLECEKYDLLILTNGLSGKNVMSNEFVAVENLRSGLHGIVPTDSVYILPILNKPSFDLLELFKQEFIEQQIQSNNEQSNYCTNTVLPYHQLIPSNLIYRPYTLEQFAAENFYQSSKLVTENKIALTTNETNINLTNSCLLNYENQNINIDETKALPASNNIRTLSRGNSLLAAIPVVNNRSVMLPLPLPLPNLFNHNDLWRWSPKLIKRPLLKCIGSIMEAPSMEAVLSFEYILKYMNDLPASRPKYFLEFTDIIFRAPLKYQILRDEIYCQLMKQLTDNINLISEDRGWELMWLCLGLFPPSVKLEKELNRFLRSRYLPIAVDCLIRLQKIVKVSGFRKFPPHQVEVEAIQHKTTQIFHKVFLPNSTEEVIEVDSLTTGSNFITQIATRLHLKSSVGFNIFVKVGDRIISMPDKEYLFDFIQQLADWTLKNQIHLKYSNDHLNIFAYQIIFMRKLWINVKPGEDLNADLIFHYYQELPKYLRGYHNVTQQQAAQIGALILRAQTRNDKVPPLQQFQHIAADILPRDLIKVQKTSEWKKLIMFELEQQTAQTSEEAKLKFLEAISHFPTFGSAFFEVKQSSDPTLASRVIVAINCNGINLFNQDNKEPISSYPFSAMNNWTSGNTYFHLTVGSLIKGNRLLFETTLGYKMDDLLTSYIQLLLSAIDQNQKQFINNNNNNNSREIYEV